MRVCYYTVQFPCVLGRLFRGLPVLILLFYLLHYILSVDKPSDSTLIVNLGLQDSGRTRYIVHRVEMLVF